LRKTSQLQIPILFLTNFVRNSTSISLHQPRRFAS
jgi:hypothetical protein